MNIDGVYSELRLDTFGDWLGVVTDSGKSVLERSRKPCSWSSSLPVLQRKTAQIQSFRQKLDANGANSIKNLDSAFKEIAESSRIASEVVKEESAFAEECYGQLLFRHEMLTPINHIPFFLILLRFFKIYVTPAMAVAMPLLTVILPYILVKYVFGIPMPLSVYIGIVKQFYTGNGFKGLMPTPDLDGQLAQVHRSATEGTQDFLGKMKFYGQTAWLLFSFGQSMWQPIQTARHLAKLDQTLCSQGEAIRRIYNNTVTIRNILEGFHLKVARLPFEEHEVQDDRIAVASVLESPNRFKLLLELIGEWEVLFRFASHSDICPVRWITPSESANCSLRLRNTFDIHVVPQKRVKISVILHKKTHAILTGPNRGGKSTALRAIGRSVFLAHNYGVAVGEAAAMTPLDYIQTCLRLEDIPGSASLFEREVAIASLALQRSQSLRGLVLIDELFHSTNPPDAEIASRLFLKQLWASKQTLSIISTHMFQLLDLGTQSKVQKLCCPASYRTDGSVDYKYGLAKGICTVSSVKEILKEKGFPASRA